MIYVVTLFCILIHGCYMGSRLVATLYALELGANPLEVGVLGGLYAAFSLMLAIYAGQLSDRLGPRIPMTGGCALTFVALMIAYLFPTMNALYVSAAVIGAAFIFFNVSIQNYVGLISNPASRARNFSTLSQGYSISTTLSPLGAGYAVDHLGTMSTYLVFAVISLGPTIALLLLRRMEPARTSHAGAPADGSWVDLLRNKPLRTSFISSGLVVTGWDLYSFYFPVHGHSIGMSASTIGVVLSIFGAAAFIARSFMPILIRRYGEIGLLARSLFVSAAWFLLFPFSTNTWVLAALSFALGLTLGLGQPLSMMITYNRSPQGRSGEANGIRLMVNHFTHFAVPILSGALGTAFGVGPVFWINAVLLTGAGRLLQRSG